MCKSALPHIRQDAVLTDRMGFYLYVSQQARQPHRQRGNVGYQHQHHKDRCKISQQRLYYLLNLGLSYLYSYKQGGSHWRRDSSDTQIEDHHNTEMNGVHPQCLADGQKNRGEDQTGRRHIHKGSHNQEKDIDDEKDHIPVVADSQHCLRYGRWDSRKCHYPAHDAGHTDEENDDTRHLRAVKENLRQFRGLDGLVKKHGQHQAVHNSYYASLRSGKDTGNNASDYHNNHEQTGNGL